MNTSTMSPQMFAHRKLDGDNEVEEEIVQVGQQQSETSVDHMHALEAQTIVVSSKKGKDDDDDDEEEDDDDEDEDDEDADDKEDSVSLSSPEQITQVGQLLHSHHHDQISQQQKLAQLQIPTGTTVGGHGIPMLPPFPMLQTQSILQPPIQVSTFGGQPYQTRSLTPQQIQLLGHQPLQLPPNQHVVVSHGHNQGPQGVQQVVIPSQVTEQQLLTQPEHSMEPNSPGSDEMKGSRKTRWRPTQEQRQTLESVWLGNPYPEAATKHHLVKQFGSSVTYKQITSWFKHKRENDKNRGKFQYKYSPAMKFNSEQVIILEGVFVNEPYAKGKTLTDLANQLGVSVKRVQNWFKHKRSRLAQQGKFEYKPRNLLNSEQITFLRGAFFTNPSPTPELCEQLSSELNVKPEQVTRWFSNERSRKRKREEQNKMGHIIDAEEEIDEDGLGLPKQIDLQTKSRRGRKSKSALSETLQQEPTAQLLPLQVDTVDGLTK